MYFEVLMTSTDIHCHSHRSYVSCCFVVRLLFVCILAEMHSSVRLVLTDSLICCVNLFRVIAIGRSLPANVVSLVTFDGHQSLPTNVVSMDGLSQDRLFLLCLLGHDDFGMPCLSRLLYCATLVQALPAAPRFCRLFLLRQACAGSSCCISCHDACTSVLNRVRTL